VSTQGFALDVRKTYCQCERTDLKEQRLQIRIHPAAKHRLELAAAAARQTVSSFVLQAAEARAHEVLADSAVIQLAPAPGASEEALEPSPPVDELLVHALRAPKKHPKRHAKTHGKKANRSKNKDKKKHQLA
jgi:uncharacterized protein (DUF1778 family)